MAILTNNRAKLMLGCGGAAMALSLALSAGKAQAQAFQATDSVVSGVASRAVTGANSETITVETPTAVIDWTPQEDAAGNALDFLPTGATATFQNNGSANPGGDFAVLNRILPSTNGNIVVMDGTVISRIVDLQAGTSVAGGTVAFYSPTGLLIGGNASFDVGNLILTTLEPDLASFDSFATAGGTLALDGTANPTARIEIQPGAQITASAENSYFVVSSAEIVMNGTSRVNGSQAFVAADIANLTFSNGLFDIEIPLGTTAASPVTINGNVGGPSSTGAGDNHLIYAVAKAQADPITMLFSGNLGFDPAASAGIVNGEIILSANYDVFGRTVQGGSIADGINAVFGEGPDPFLSQPLGPGNIRIEDAAVSNNLLAIGDGQTLALAVNAASQFDGDVLLVGRQEARLDAEIGQTIDVTGDVLVSARAFGAVGSSFIDPTIINATGGQAVIEASSGANLSIGGNALVTADSLAGRNDFDLTAGISTAGFAQVAGAGGTLTILGGVDVSADASGLPPSPQLGITTGAASTGGQAELFVFDGGSVSIGQAASVSANANGVDGDAAGSTASDAFGGLAQLLIGQTGGTLDIGTDLQLAASAQGGLSSSADVGSIGSAGRAAVIADAPDTITIGGSVAMSAFGSGGTNLGPGLSGDGIGGDAQVLAFNDGTVLIGGALQIDADGIGGSGSQGGAGFGGFAGVFAQVGVIDITGGVVVDSSGFGGNSNGFGFGADGGDGTGGNAFVQANGNLTQAASVSAASVQLTARGTGGTGGAGDGSIIAPGAGGNGQGGLFGTPNQAAPDFSNGVFLLAGGDNGSITITGSSFLDTTGTGGTGGQGNGGQPGGAGGTGSGGTSQAGLFFGDGDGSVGLGTANLGDVFVDANGFGGDGGVGVEGDIGVGGAGLGGNGVITVRAGALTAGIIDILSDGEGGQGSLGGDGTGGRASLVGGLGGSATLAGFVASALGRGGVGDFGGDGLGGEAFMGLQGIDVTVNGDAIFDASGFGGESLIGAGGGGTGGIANIAISDPVLGNGTITGTAAIQADGFGGIGSEGEAGGFGTGGEAYILAQAGGGITLGSALVTAGGLGGSGTSTGGGAGLGGLAYIESFDAGSQVVIQNNTPFAFLTQLARGIVSANGIGGDTTGLDGFGGTGQGGQMRLIANGGGLIELPADPAGDPDSLGQNVLAARGFGGGSSVEGGVGGQGIGGTAEIALDGGTIISGAMNLSAFSRGGSSLDSALNISGGEAFGGTRILSLANGAEMTASIEGGVSGGVGGDGSGTGNGGQGSGGAITADIRDSTLNLVGFSIFIDQTQGGFGDLGGAALGGLIDFTATNSVINITPDASGTAVLAIGGPTFGGGGVSQGGPANGTTVSVTIENTTITGGSIEATANAVGGAASGVEGVGGAANGGAVIFTTNPSTLDLTGQSLIQASASGGAGATGGDAIAGSVNVTFDQTDITITPDANNEAGLFLDVFAGAGVGAQMGVAEAGTISLDLLGSSISANRLGLTAEANADGSSSEGIGAGAFGGLISATFAGSSLSVLEFDLFTNAASSAGGFASGGEAILAAGSAGGGELLQIDTLLDMSADATGGDSNLAGRFEVAVTSGEVSAAAFGGTALGGATGDLAPSRISAIGGNFLVSGAFTVDVLDNFNVEAGQGGLIGGPSVASPSAAISVTSQGTITFAGDDDNTIDFGGLSVALASRDIAIENGARIGAQTMDFVSLDADSPAILGGEGTPGGAVSGEGYTLIAEELGRLEAGSFSFTQPVLVEAGPATPSIILRDTTAFGSASPDGGTSNILVQTSGFGGIIRVDGFVEVIDAAATDSFTLFADDRIEVLTPGGIALVGTDGRPTGALALEAGDIWVADADLIGQLRDDPAFAGRNEALATAAEGSDDPLGYLRAGTVDLLPGFSLLVRNTGTEIEQGGITVSESLSIDRGANSESQLDVFAYGRRQRADGTFVTGNDFFAEVNLNDATGTLYLDDAAFNDCVINSNDCPAREPVIEEEVATAIARTNNPTVVEGAVDLPPDEIPLTESESNDEFGVDFPGLVEAPLLTEDPSLDDPVASGGDSSAYGDDNGAEGEDNGE